MKNSTKANDSLENKLLTMNQKDFFAESMMFLVSKIAGITNGTVSPEEFQQSKTLVDSITQARKLVPYLNKPLPKYPESGWLFPYLMEGDSSFGSKRWEWWTDCLLSENIEGEIPQITFHSSSQDKGVLETIRHMEEILRGIERFGSGSSLIIFAEWLLWSLGSKSVVEKRCSNKIDRFLYEKFELGRLQLHPFDYFAKFAQESRGNSRWGNPTSFYQTPQTVCKAMAQMLFAKKSDPTLSVLEPCAGTGTMLLEVSNYSVNLYAQEISHDLVLMCEANSYLYIPWLVRPASFLKAKIEKPKPQKDIPQEVKKIIVDSQETQYATQNGQLTLFDNLT